MNFQTISVVGLGYIGLPTAALIASKNINVIGIDINQNIVDTINRAEIHIIEQGLAQIVKVAVDTGYLRASSNFKPADVFIIAVPTPFKGIDHAADLSYIEAAAKSIAKVLKKGNLIILESTSPVGATEQMIEWLSNVRPDLTFPRVGGGNADIHVAYCPERVLPGNVITELVRNDRVIGGITQSCSEHAKEFYKLFVSGDCIITNTRTAEMSKLTENSFRDINIAFANELSIICDELNINVWELIRIANRHPRVNILQPGPGVGGHCIAVDPWFIINKTPNLARLIKMARQVNDSKPMWVIEKVKVAIADYLAANPSRHIKDITIGCYGLAFKPDIDDLRESPALQIVREIADAHPGSVVAVDSNISQVIGEKFRLLNYEEADEIVNIAVLLVDHHEFKSREKPSVDFIVDTKGIWL